MKLKLLSAFAAVVMSTAPAFAMDCCKDGKCACCEKMKEPAQPAPQPR